MNIKNPFSNKPFKYSFLLFFVLAAVYAILRLFFFSSDPVIPFLTSLYDLYLILPRGIANLLFKISNVDVFVKDYELIFENTGPYHLSIINSITNWPNSLLYKNWSILTLAVIWLIGSSFRKKLLYSFFFFLTHMFSVVSGLYLLGVTGPFLYDYKPGFILYPTLIGTFAMFSLIALWLKSSKNEIQRILQKIKLGIVLPNRRINEIIIVSLFFLLLRSFIVPFFDFHHYVNLLLLATSAVASLFNHYGYIEGVYLTGEMGAIFIDKGCLGFISMYVFAAIVYLTRSNNERVTWLYIISGFILLQILNIMRLAALFIVIQGEDGFARANRHHEIYNIIIYVFIFALWIVWFEFFLGRKKKKQELL